MRSIPVILLLALFWSCTSCNENNPQTDAEIDKDNSVVDSKVDEFPDDLSDEVNTEADETLDADAEECLPSLMEAPFPYKDNEGNITFCRPGCDTPTENDPQCMSNLWKEQNEALCTQLPQYDCCGYPCVMESLKPITEEDLISEHESLAKYIPMHKCDLMISQFEWSVDGTAGVVKSWNMSEGKVGFHLVPSNLSMEEWPVQKKAVTYDIATQKYSFIAPQRTEMLSYHKGKRIALTGDTRTIDQFIDNIYLAYIGDDGTYELAYSKKIGYLPYEPALNDKWVFANIQEQNSTSKMMYAKVGEWKWIVLGEGYGWEPGIVGNTLVFIDDDVNGWVCDLSKNPKKVTDCRKVNREGEDVRGIRINKNNETKFVYNSNIMKLVYLELKDGSFIYNDLIKDFTAETEKNAYSLAALEYRDNILLFEEITSDGSQPGGLLCYYRIDKEKKYCMKKMERDKSYEDGTTIFPYGFSEFEDKWLLYQKKGSTPLILRDMDCYCKEEGVCPFEE